MKIGFEISICKHHNNAFYGPVIEVLRKEFGKNFEVIDSNGMDGLAAFDGHYDLIVVTNRRAAQMMVDQFKISKSFLIDHAPIHSNRAPLGSGHFELFSSPIIKQVYESCGFRPAVRGYVGGYFLTDHLDSIHPEPQSCLVYLIHWKWARANSHERIPFSDESTLNFLQKLAVIFKKVYVVSHVSNQIGNYAELYRDQLHTNVQAVKHGQEFLNLICNVDAVVFEYSSVFATALWNPQTPLFQRRPPKPRGPAKPHATFFHQLMNWVSYPIESDIVDSIPERMIDDPKKDVRRQVKDLIYDQQIKNPGSELIKSIHDVANFL